MSKVLKHTASLDLLYLQRTCPGNYATNTLPTWPNLVK